MSLLSWSRIAFAAVLVTGGATRVAANEPVEKSGRTYHQAVCARGQGQGVARCFAHVVVDARGDEIDGKPNASPLIAPSGLGPADLRSAYNTATSGSGSASTVVAIVDAYGYTNAETDLGVYRRQYGIAAFSFANVCQPAWDIDPRSASNIDPAARRYQAGARTTTGMGV